MNTFTKQIFFGLLLIGIPFFLQAQTPTKTYLIGSNNFFDSTLAYVQFKSIGPVVYNKAKKEYYQADGSSRRIRRIKNGVVTTLVGNGVQGVVDGQGDVVRLNGPSALALNPSGDTLFFTDGGNNRDGRVRYVVLNGLDSGRVTTIAGAGGGSPPASNNEVGTSARLAGGLRSLVYQKGYLYFSDPGTDRLRRIYLGGTFPVTSLDTTGSFSNDLAAGRRTVDVFGLTKSRFDSLLYFSSPIRRVIYKINIQTGRLDTLAGTGKDNFNNGTLRNSIFGALQSIAFDSASNSLYTTETGNNNKFHGVRVLKLDSNLVTNVAGVINSGGFSDGIGAAARFNKPSHISFDSAGRLLVADGGNSAVRIVDPNTRAVTTLYGRPKFDTEVPNPFSVNLKEPQGLVVDKNNNIWFADRANHVIRKYDAATKKVSIVAGRGGVSGAVNGSALTATFNEPFSLALKNDSLFISDGAASNPDSNGIRILNLTTNQVSRFARVRGGLVIHKNSVIVFGNGADGASFFSRIIRINISTGARDTVGGASGSGFLPGVGKLARLNNPKPGGIYKDTLYFVANGATNRFRIVKIDLTETNLRVDSVFSAAQISGIRDPSAIIVDGFGNFFTSNVNTGSAYGIARGNVVNRTTSGGFPISLTGSSTVSLGLDTNKNYLIGADLSTNQIYKLGPLYSIANVPPTYSLLKSKDTLWRKDTQLKTVTGVAGNASPNTTPFNTIQNQTVTFVATVADANLSSFSQLPAVSPDGVLTYKLSGAVPFSGTGPRTIPVSIVAKDNGGTDDGGVDVSAAQTFNIVIRYQNLAPSANFAQDTLTYFSNQTNQQTLVNFLSGIAAGAATEPNQSFTITVTPGATNLFSAIPTLSGNNPNRSLSFRLNGNTGETVLQFRLRDNGGTANGGTDTLVKNVVLRVLLFTELNEAVSGKGKISFAPNPASQSIQLLGLDGTSEIEILDLSGKRRKSLSIANSEFLTVSDLPKGIYLIRVYKDEVPVYTGKLLRD